MSVVRKDGVENHTSPNAEKHRCNDWDDPLHAFKVAGPAENDDIGREKAPKPIGKS